MLFSAVSKNRLFIQVEKWSSGNVTHDESPLSVPVGSSYCTPLSRCFCTAFTSVRLTPYFLYLPVKGKNMVRTRSSVIKEDLSKAVKSVMEIKSEKKAVIGLRSGLNRAHKAVAIVKAQKRRADKAKLQRAGLRSGGKLDPKTVAKESPMPKAKKSEQVCAD